MNAFAKATESYGMLPSAPIRAYGAVNRFDRLVVASGNRIDSDNGLDRAWERMNRALEVENQANTVAAQTDSALTIINDYSAMLKVLSSNDYTEELEKGALALGESVDKAISTYNDKFVPAGKAKLTSIGGAVAAAIRGGGGVYLRNRQAIALRDAVTTADPVITRLTTDVTGMMRNKLRPDLATLEERLSEDFKTSLKPGGKFLAEPPPLGTYLAVTESIERIRNASALADAAAVAAEKFAAAHAKLASELTRRRSIKDRIQEIETLSDEIQAANKLRKTLEK